MSDTLLTNLCTICHVSPPKYKCPRCATRTCSLPCTKKHKSWSDCTGVRDATAYVPKKRLATAAGIDHDYNFISAIERSRERSERDLVEERGILDAEELRPVTVENVEHRFRGGKMRKVLVTKALRGKGGDDEWDAMRGRLARFDITLVRAPVGMSRRRENQTKYFKRTKRIEWFVEWYLVESVRGVAGADADAKGETITTRVTTQLVDDVPIYEAFLRNRKTRTFGTEKEEATDGAESKQSRPRPSGPNSFQDAETSAWIPGTSLCSQNPRTGQWHDRTQQPHENRHALPLESLESLRGRARFFLSRPATTSSAPTTLAPIDPGDKLHDVLAGTAVLEYPTLYVLEQGVGVPPGFVMGSKPRGLKRRTGGGHGPGGGGQTRGPKARRLVEELEEGEVESEGPAEPKAKGRGVVDYSDSESESESSDSESSESESDSDGEEEVLGEVSLSEDDGDGDEDGDDDQGLGLDEVQ